MTIRQALAALDGSQYNTMPQEEKVRYLSELDRFVFDLMGEFEKMPPVFSGYDADTDPDTELLAPPPLDGMYLHWLRAQVDLHNREYTHFNNSSALYQTAWQAFSDHYLRTNTPKNKGKFH